MLRCFQLDRPGLHPVPDLEIADVPPSPIVFVSCRNRELGIADLEHHVVLAVPGKVHASPDFKTAFISLESRLDEPLLVVKENAAHPTEAAPFSMNFSEGFRVQNDRFTIRRKAKTKSQQD